MCPLDILAYREYKMHTIENIFRYIEKAGQKFWTTNRLSAALNVAE